MELWWWFGGWARVRLTSARCLMRLQELSRQVKLENLSWETELTVTFSIRRRDLKELPVREGETWEILSRHGLPELAKRVGNWKTFTSAVLFLGGLTVWLSGRVLFLTVEGNGDIPANRILAAAEDCGVYFGADRREIRSEAVKNHLLYAIPQLRWAGVNTAGCVATITVSARSLEEMPEDTSPGDLVAVRDAVVTDVFLSTGTALAASGQAVRAGETLISGSTDVGLLVRQDRAAGEVYGLTRQGITAKLPETLLRRQGTGRVERHYSLRLGKKSIKFTFGSGIPDTTCVKMVTVNYLTLPGGFRLPAAVVTETCIRYETAVTGREDAAQQLLDGARDYARSRMAAGTILAEDWETAGCSLTARFECREMIARFRPVGNWEGDTNDDRETGERGAG